MDILSHKAQKEQMSFMQQTINTGKENTGRR